MKATISYSPLLNKVQQNNAPVLHKSDSESSLPTTDQVVNALDYFLKRFTTFFFAAAIPYVLYLMVQALLM
ncbi:hypothetical protein J2S74_003976 [Evansella vedderi]|uniref:Uncharacterized protein n=1 Tax=Evansella vedderi TaxID=38282 RepID=A0ABU0A0P1_9BACI|nr:hypothetical protein [Evansella vedderi]MDQ0256556.1 hypothetical protein [Evansella vedderi]